MVRRILVLALALGVAGLVAPGAADAQPSRVTISATSTTPWTDAGGTAVFVASGLPRGTAYLQWFDPATKTWKRQATVKKSGSKGAVTSSALPQGVNKFRIISGSATSPAMYVKTYGIYTWDLFNKSHAFGPVTMAARD